MFDNEIQYHLNFRQKDFYDAAKEHRLVRLAMQARRKTKNTLPLLNSFVKLSLLAFLVYELAVMIYG